MSGGIQSAQARKKAEYENEQLMVQVLLDECRRDDGCLNYRVEHVTGWESVTMRGATELTEVIWNLCDSSRDTSLSDMSTFHVNYYLSIIHQLLNMLIINNSIKYNNFIKYSSVYFSIMMFIGRCC